MADTSVSFPQVLRWFRKNAQPEIIPLYDAILNLKISVGLHFPGTNDTPLWSKTPLISIICDDHGWSRGPAGFDPVILKELFSRSKSINVAVGETEPSFYEKIVTASIGTQSNVVIIETMKDHQGAWVDFSLRSTPDVNWLGTKFQGDA